MREVHLPNGKIRRYRSRDEIQALVAEFKASGVSRGEFAQSKGININVLTRWLDRETGAGRRAPQMREVQVEAIGSAQDCWAAELALGSGVALRVHSTASTELVSMLWSLAQSKS